MPVDPSLMRCERALTQRRLEAFILFEIAHVKFVERKPGWYTDSLTDHETE